MAEHKFGGGCISENLYNWMIANFEGKTLLEFGSGRTSGMFAEHMNVYSIEHDPKYMWMCPKVHYFTAPLNQWCWYDPAVVSMALQFVKYDIILVDGPPAVNIHSPFSRHGVIQHLAEMDLTKVFVFDDINRRPERELFNSAVAIVKRRHRRVVTSQGLGHKKRFGIINAQFKVEK